MGDFEQLSILASDAVTEVRLSVGAVGNHHLQLQMEAYDSERNLVALKSWPHRELAQMESVALEALTRCLEVIRSRHCPFDPTGD